MPNRGLTHRLARSLSAAGALAAAGDFAGLGRRFLEQATRSRRPLPDDLAPAPRANVSLRSRGELLVMAGPALARSGAPLSQFELARGLSSLGWNVLTLAPADGPLAPAYREAGLELEIWPSLHADPAVPAWYERGVAALAGALERLGPGAIYANTLDLFPAIDAARIAGLPSLWNIREGERWQTRLSDRHPAIAARALACFSYPAAVIHVAGATQEAWAPFTPAAQSHVIYNAPSRPVTGPRAAPVADEFRILSVGTLCARKGQLDLVSAQARLPPDLLSRTRIVFIGGQDPAYAAAMKRAMQPQNAPFFTMMGEVEDVAPYLLKADLLVHCAQAEAFPRVFLEAAAAGVAILATRAGGSEERMGPEAALFFDAGDVDALARGITRLARDPALRQKLAESARRELVERWTSTEMVAAYERLVRHALASADQGV